MNKHEREWRRRQAQEKREAEQREELKKAFKAELEGVEKAVMALSDAMLNEKKYAPFVGRQARRSVLGAVLALRTARNDMTKPSGAR